VFENRLLASGGDVCVVRTGALVGEREDDNCIVAKTYETLLKPHARMAEDNVYSVTSLADVVEALLLVSVATKHHIYHGVASPEVSRTELAQLIIQASRFGVQMGYAPCAFSDIAYPEPRGRNTWMKNTRIGPEFGYTFKPSHDAVREKVALLDRWRESRL